jgi:hypothetical protein
MANALPRTLEKRTMRGLEFQKLCGLAALVGMKLIGTKLIGMKNVLEFAARKTSWRIK